jgi:DNA polymerase/3'-5' exonuclease PolX
MKLKDAIAVAEKMRDILAPFCVRYETLGSICRRKLEPGDIDIVCIPDLTTKPRLEFGRPPEPNWLRWNLSDLCARGLLTFTSGAEKLRKYTLCTSAWLPGAVTETVKIQIEICTPDDFAYWQMVRTGPKEFSKWMVTAQKYRGALPDGWKFEGARLLHDGVVVPCADERDIFSALRMDYPMPETRNEYWRWL